MEPIYKVDDAGIGFHRLWIAPAYADKAREACLSFAQEKNLSLDSPMVFVTRTTRGTTEEASTLGEYHFRYDELKKFCWIVGDWQSACIFDRSHGDDESGVVSSPSRVCPTNPHRTAPGQEGTD